MEEMTLSIDGRSVRGFKGATILDICRANDIYLPTLCHLDGLSEHGGCRLCLVEVEGQRRPVPACATPATDNMKVLTQTPKLHQHRRLALEMLLSERNHYCFICEKTGDCELQSLCYEFGIDHMSLPAMFPALALDSSSENVAIDNNRCILCGRCIRVCNEIVGNDTLGYANRGSKTVINEPAVLPLGCSNCIQCGACIDVCPTGAIFGKLSSYRGRPEQCQIVETTCPECPMGCNLRVYVRDNNIVRIAGGGPEDRFGGQLCRMGRFDLLVDRGERVLRPRIHKGRSVTEVDLGSALKAGVDLLKATRKEHGPGSIAGIVSLRCTNQTMKAFSDLMNTMGVRDLYMLEPNSGVSADGMARTAARIAGLGADIHLQALAQADTILLAGMGPSEPYPIIASYVRRALNRGAALLSIGIRDHNLTARADVDLRTDNGGLGPVMTGLAELLKRWTDDGPAADIFEKCRAAASEMRAALHLLGRDGRMIMLAGRDATSDPSLAEGLAEFAASMLRRRGPAMRVFLPGSGSNIVGARTVLGGRAKSLPHDLDRAGLRGAYVLLSDEVRTGSDHPLTLEGLDALVVQTSYESPLAKQANVVIPSPTWAERSGTTTALDGEVRPANPPLARPENVAPDEKAVVMFEELWKGVRGVR